MLIQQVSPLDTEGIWPYTIDMATPQIKSTFSMDLETTRLLEGLARRWRVTKSEALRRAIRSAASEAPSLSDSISALRELQDSLRLPAPEADRWAAEVRAERGAAGRRIPGADV